MSVIFNTAKINRSKPSRNVQWEKYLNGHAKRTDRIGEVIEYARYGDYPPNDKSRMWITLGEGLQSYPELPGLSVFEIVNGVEVRLMKYGEDLFKRPRYTGLGRIVGWGPDGEVLVERIE